MDTTSVNQQRPLRSTSTFTTPARRLGVVAAGAALLFAGAGAQADIVSSSGQILGPSNSPPGSGSFRLGDQEDNTRSWVHREQYQVPLPAGTKYDAHNPGGYNSNGDLESGSPDVPNAGSLVNVYIIHFDPTSGIRQTTGTLVFENPIYIQSRNDALDGSDGALGFSGVSYPRFFADRGYDLLGTDSFSINILANGNWQLDFDARSSTGMDQLRVIEFANVPAPGTLGLLGAGGLVAARRRRR